MFSNMVWSFGVEKVAGYSTDPVVGQVLDSVWPRRDSIAKFADDHKLSISICCNITIHVDRPVYELSPDNVKRMSDLKAQFLMDINDYSE